VNAARWSPGAAGRILQVEVDVADMAWMDDAICQQTDPEAFFPEKGGSTGDARRICRGCDVREECLEYALENDERFGIWGGMSERQRRPMRAARKAAA